MQIVTELIAANANVNQANNEGATPLYVACRRPRDRQHAARCGANRPASNHGVTPLYIACHRGHVEVG